MGGDGVFVMEIEHALLQRNIDLAVHSLKDLPTTQPEGLCVFAVGTREDARDVLLVNSQSDPGSLFESDRSGYLRIGTCSLRRSAQIRALFPQSEILPLRGNVDTRLHKLDAGDYDGIVLAAAGLHRLGKREQLANRMNYLSIEVMMPAPGQGALALECRNEQEIQMLIAPLRNTVTQHTTRLGLHIENLAVVALQREVIRAGETGGSCTDDGHPLTSRRVFNERHWWIEQASLNDRCECRVLFAGHLILILSMSSN